LQRLNKYPTMKTRNYLFLCLMASTFLLSCASREKLAYMQNIESQTGASNLTYEPIIQPDDLLQIIVSATDPELAIPFNLMSIGMISNPDNPGAGGQQIQQLYLVDKDGNIPFAGLGTIKVGGMTRSQVITMITEKLQKYIKDPQINFRIANFKISVEGEVNRPGVFKVATERITLLEAIAQAGDLTVYGKRDNILVIREQDGKKTHARVDLTQADFFQSPYYYLAQNDVVYVEPNKTKINASAVGPNITVIFTGISLLITILALTIK